MAKYPHHKVYVRLHASPLHGVGVFAIRDIPKGVKLFWGDEQEFVKVKQSVVEELEDVELKRLYTDFCVLKEGVFYCPPNFNDLRVGWYMNHSDTPNVGYDFETDEARTLRHITHGEELTVNYHTFSEDPHA